VIKEEMTEGRKAGRASKTKPPPPPHLSSKSGSATARTLAKARTTSVEISQ